MADFREQMEQVIEPYLQKYRKEFWLEREEGKKLHCLSYNLESPKGVVVFSHGFTENEEKCKENIYCILKGNYSVYFIEHCGHGFSYRLVEDLSKVHVDSYERYVDDFIMFSQLAKKENPDLPIYLFGHSMGGAIAACVVTKEPDLFEKVVLSSPMIRPSVGGNPWAAVSEMARQICMQGLAEEYLAGHGPYKGKGPLDRSCSMRDDQNEYYSDKKDQEPMYQTCGASNGWMYAAVEMNQYLREESPKRIKIPVLLLQAEKELLVSNEEQIEFIESLKSAGLETAELVCVLNAKHEIFNAGEQERNDFWRMTFEFLG